MESSALRLLLDKQEIYEVALRYCHGLDRLDFDLVRTCYHPDGCDQHTGFSGVREDWLVYLETVARSFDGTQHIIGNHLVDVDGDTAYAETYGTAHHWGTPADDPLLNFSCGFRYIDRLERRDGQWRISLRRAVREWTRITSPKEVRDREAPGPTGRRDQSDISYERADLTGSPGLWGRPCSG